MKHSYRLTTPDEAKAEMTISGTVGEFRHLAKALQAANDLKYNGRVDDLARECRRIIKNAEVELTRTWPEVER